MPSTSVEFTVLFISGHMLFTTHPTCKSSHTTPSYTAPITLTPLPCTTVPPPSHLMLLFPSCYSADSHDYDVIITCSDIEHITALHKTIPTIEIALLKPKGNVSGSVYTYMYVYI